MNKEDFLKIKDEFSLGDLVTESSHPLTFNLSDLCQNNLQEALKSLYKVDREALESLRLNLKSCEQLHREIKLTLEAGHKIFLGGCGATGRLSLAIEKYWRDLCSSKSYDHLSDGVVSFMAGGDVALISSIEKFEDYPKYGARQLMELNFSRNDLFLGITEGGETPFVIGATEKAAEVSMRGAFFLYCNPDELLATITTRTQAVLKNEKIFKCNLTCGPMALTGSTRMQASTILQLSVMLCLKHYEGSFKDVLEDYEVFLKTYSESQVLSLENFIKKESEIYLKKERVSYQCSRELGLTLLTDTTERSPTFSLQSFENDQESQNNYSLSYLHINEKMSINESWEALLGRKPRCLEWSETKEKTSKSRLEGFYINEEGIEKRLALKEELHLFKFKKEGQRLTILFQNQRIYQGELGVCDMSFQLILKMLINIHSTVVMGRIGRFEGNFMTFVKASNNKLIDRAIRYALTLSKRRGFTVSYDELVARYFDSFKKEKGPGEEDPIVLRLVENKG